MIKSLIVTLILTSSLIVAGCGTVEPEQTSDSASSAEESISEAEPQTSDTTENEDLKVFTLTELAEYDGKEGRKAYVAVNGLVYDVTDVSAWSGGTHFRNIAAGKDLTEVIESDSPHGLRVLENLTVVGELEN